jgi:hypothetical protein
VIGVIITPNKNTNVPSIAKYPFVRGQSALHCNPGFEPVQIWNVNEITNIDGINTYIEASGSATAGEAGAGAATVGGKCLNSSHNHKRKTRKASKRKASKRKIGRTQKKKINAFRKKTSKKIELK